MIETAVCDKRMSVLLTWAQWLSTRVPGDYAEVGVRKGGSAYRITEYAPNKTLHLFDTFCGMPEDDVHPAGHHKKGDFADCSLEQVKSLLCGRDVEFHPGIFPDTAYGWNWALVHVDCDIQQTVQACLDYFWMRMVKGGVMIFDDYGMQSCPGVKAAVDAWTEGELRVTPGTYQAVLINN